MMRRNTLRLCFIGFGEAGQALAAGLAENGLDGIAAWDILFPGPDGKKLRAAGAAIGVRLAASAQDAVRGSDMIVSAVTAASSLEAAQSVEPHLDGQVFLDINSVSPGRKQETAKHLAGATRYVDVAVMAPVHPARHRTPMLLAGPHAEAIEPLLKELGMNATFAGPAIGAAAAIKMVRSVMVKGLEALTYECFVAAARAGVTDQVMASLAKSFPGLDWSKTIAYNLERMAHHGARRAAEMEEVADTLRELGLEPLMALATAQRQRHMAAVGKDEKVLGTMDQGAAALLDAISAAARERDQ